MTRLARDDILTRTDLRVLADELLGPRRGRGASVTWPCPSHQPQTGRTPPVSIFTTPRGEQRWHCHACGAGGTAIDLVMATDGVNVRTALEALAARANLEPRGRAVSPAIPRVQRAPQQTSPLVGEHVARCAQLLWTERGRAVREWLHGRGFTDATLHHHQIGADPGPRHLDRARGLPWRGPAAIWPVRDPHADVAYFQARYLDPARAGGRKYDNPATTLAANPRLCFLEPLGRPRSETLFVCEGIPDGISVSQSGHRAVALLGVGIASPVIAEQLAAAHDAQPIRVAFDGDSRGQDASVTLLSALHRVGHADSAAVRMPVGVHDANDWLRADPVGFAVALDAHEPLVPSLEELGTGLEF